MSNEDRDRRTIEPTPHRIAEFRKRGEVARSPNLGAAVTSVAGALTAVAMFGTARGSVVEFFRSTLGSLDQGLTPALAGQSAVVFVGACLPAAGGALAGYLASTALQIGAPPSLAPFKFEPQRAFQLSGLKQLFDLRESAWRVLKSVLKLALVGAFAWGGLSSDLDAISVSGNLSADGILEFVAHSIGRLVASAGIALVVLGIADFVVSKRRLMARMRMTPEELKREMKDQEGDPDIKRRRRARMRELARRRIAVEVPKADVIVLNPTHYAVAIRYRSEEGGAPRVVAKGKDAVAAKIREIARANDIPMLRKPSLARLLYKTVREGAEIPPNLYRAVAEVLAYIYRLRKGRTAS